MVKADARRDYYADLELPSAATAEEIRKQFHKLGESDGFYGASSTALIQGLCSAQVPP